MKQVQFGSYEEYVEAQTRTNKQKLGKVAVSAAELARVARYVRRRIPSAQFGICHGVRNGYEVQQLRARLSGVRVIGTEISDTATQFENVIQWDFHEVKPEWIAGVDFIYSNSWDHTYDFPLLVDRWLSCLRPGGRLFMQWSRAHSEEGVTVADSFGASLREVLGIIQRRATVETVLRIPYDERRSLLQNVRRFLTARNDLVRVIVVRSIQDT